MFSELMSLSERKIRPTTAIIKKFDNLNASYIS